MSNEYIIALKYIITGLAGVYAHWFKKRYVDNTTESNFLHYMNGKLTNTIYAIGGIFFAEAQMSLLQVGDMGLKDFIAAFTLGYSIDSGVNRMPELPKKE